MNFQIFTNKVFLYSENQPSAVLDFLPWMLGAFIIGCIGLIVCTVLLIRSSVQKNKDKK